jgi:hypothetical protein
MFNHRHRFGDTMKKKLHPYALSLRMLKPGMSITKVVYANSVPTDSITGTLLDTVTVISINHDNTVVCYNIMHDRVEFKLEELGIPVLDKGQWSKHICTLPSTTAQELMRQHIDATREPLNRGYMVDRPATGNRQLVNASGTAISPNWGK